MTAERWNYWDIDKTSDMLPPFPIDCTDLESDIHVSIIMMILEKKV